VSLKGSLDTVALPEVLQLLVDTSKSGELYVRGTRPGGRLWFDTGALSGFEVGRSEEVADALFELLRVDSGEFSFHADAPRSQTARLPANGREDVRPALRTALSRLEEWVEIVAVIPTLEHLLSLSDDVQRDDISLDRFQWSLLVAIGEGHSVQDVLDARKLPEFDGCKAVKALLDASLIKVDEPAKSALPVFNIKSAAPVEEPVVEDATAKARSAPVINIKPAAPVVQPVVEDAAPAEAQVAADPEVEAGAQDGDAPVDQSDELPIDGRAAMQALLAELAPHDDEEAAEAAPSVDEEPVDGLQDRGPWTSSELQQMGGWQDASTEETVDPPDQHAAVSERAPNVSDESGSAFHPGSVYEPAEIADGAYEAAPQEPVAYSAVAQDSVAQDFGADDQDARQAAVYQPSGYEQPVYEEPSHEQPAYEQPAYEQPAYEQPAYEQPAYEQPAHGEAGYEAEPDEEAADEGSEEPINRGLLLKFLSSVRN
jgi:uncharacterized protein DUF4388